MYVCVCGGGWGGMVPLETHVIYVLISSFRSSVGTGRGIM